MFSGKAGIFYGIFSDGRCVFCDKTRNKFNSVEFLIHVINKNNVITIGWQ